MLLNLSYDWNPNGPNEFDFDLLREFWLFTLSVCIWQAAEYRSQHKNRTKAFKRLREVIAMEGDYLLLFWKNEMSLSVLLFLRFSWNAWSFFGYFCPGWLSHISCWKLHYENEILQRTIDVADLVLLCLSSDTEFSRMWEGSVFLIWTFSNEFQTVVHAFIFSHNELLLTEGLHIGTPFSVESLFGGS
jgi:hypothetical protein